MNHAVGKLAAIQLRTAPFHAGVCGAFQKMHAVDPGEALDIIQRKHHRFVDQPGNHQAIFRRINLRNAAVVAFKAEARGCDDPVKLVERREVDRAFTRSREPFHIAAHHMGFKP